MKIYIGVIDSEYVTLPPVLIRANSLKDAKIKVLEYWSQEELKLKNVSIYEVNDKMFDKSEDVVEIPYC